MSNILEQINDAEKKKIELEGRMVRLQQIHASQVANTSPKREKGSHQGSPTSEGCANGRTTAIFDPVIDSMQQHLMRRRSEAAKLRQILAEKRSLLAEKNAEVADINERAMDMLEEQELNATKELTRIQTSMYAIHCGQVMPTTLASFLPPAEELERSISGDGSDESGEEEVDAPSVASSAVERSAASATPPLIGNEVLSFSKSSDWLSHIRPKGPALPAAVACPFTEFSTGNFYFIKNPFKTETEELLKRVGQLSPLPVLEESYSSGGSYYSGIEEEKAYNIADVTDRTDELAEDLRKHQVKYDRAQFLKMKKVGKTLSFGPLGVFSAIPTTAEPTPLKFGHPSAYSPLVKGKPR